MAIAGIGTDIVSIQRISELQCRYPKRFPQRILSQPELLDFTQAGQSALFLAKRFAAKEAAVKALGTGFREGISFADFTVGHTALGKPELMCTGIAARLVDQRNISGIHLSLSDEAEFAVAFVILETN
ncbi:MAG: holo-ACP synthase [Thiotrichales bacterium]